MAKAKYTKDAAGYYKTMVWDGTFDEHGRKHRICLRSRKSSADLESKVKDVYGDVLFTAPLIAANVAHPLLQEIASELTTDGRCFSFCDFICPLPDIHVSLCYCISCSLYQAA